MRRFESNVHLFGQSPTFQMSVEMNQFSGGMILKASLCQGQTAGEVVFETVTVKMFLDMPHVD